MLIAAGRLKSDIDVEDAVRENLEVDRDTRNVPGSPPIFETIMAKIASASVFVPDLTFVGKRDNQKPVSNPNVLIEYGLALHKPGHLQIIAVMNDVFGKPTEEDMPFNLRHRRFPITYSLPEGATEEERKTAQKLLVDKLEFALRAIFDSPDYKASAKSVAPSAVEVAVLYQKDRDYGYALSSLSSREGVKQIRETVRALFEAIEAKCREVNSASDAEIEVASHMPVRDLSQVCVLRKWQHGMVVHWEQRYTESTEGIKLGVREVQGSVRLPGESLAGVHVGESRKLTETFYTPTLSREHEIGWARSTRSKEEPKFISTEELADACVVQFVNLLRKDLR
ncbi:hypothetical protein [Granulicella sp. L60]|uniref:hypothetical protein n=1 Tax=Granulicella sp. L60 TaxID=1641866 RepID=UPI00131E96DB|nr:hypothetical protein [Granulicella sp. L60]